MRSKQDPSLTLSTSTREGSNSFVETAQPGNFGYAPTDKWRAELIFRTSSRLVGLLLLTAIIGGDPRRFRPLVDLYP
jgi:hypothetical protein